MVNYSVNHNKVKQSYKTWEPVYHVGYICYEWILYYSLFVKKQTEAKSWDQNVQHEGTFYSLDAVLTDKLAGWFV